MNIHEYQAKQLLAKYGVAVPKGGVAYTPERREELQFWLLMLLTTWGDSSFAVLMEGPVMAIWFWFALGFATGRSLTPGEETDASVSFVGTERKTAEAHRVPFTAVVGT